MNWMREHLGAFYEGARLAGYEGREQAFARILEDALWSGDVNRLDELAGCRCCCHEHTFEWCPARVWGGCRGQGSMTRAELESWVTHYERFHGLTRDQFFE
jgi:hypothetical protein